MSDEIIKKIRSGQVGVMPTDTVFGVVASALLPDAVMRIYREKVRPRHKPFVIIISGYGQLHEIGIDLNLEMRSALEKIWPAPVSVLLTCPGAASDTCTAVRRSSLYVCRITRNYASFCRRRGR